MGGKGGKNRRRGKGDGEESKRELEFKEDGQEYSQVVKMPEMAVASVFVSTVLPVLDTSVERCERRFGLPRVTSCWCRRLTSSTSIPPMRRVTSSSTGSFLKTQGLTKPPL